MVSLLSRIRKQPSSQPPPCAHQLEAQSRQDADPASSDASKHKHEQGDQQRGEVSVPLDEKGRCVPCKEEKTAARKYRWRVIAGLIFPFALQALDVTIIATALPWIATDFGEVSQLNWIISAFNLTSATFIPFWGQVADIFGRHSAIQAAIVIMMIGSALCTAAPTRAFPLLLLGRGIQGLGCAGLNVVVRVILSDKGTLQETSKNWSVFSFTAGMSYGIGPVVGGALTNVSWRWCFAVNLPICVAAILLIATVLRKDLLGPQPLPALDEQPGEPPGPALTTHFTRRLMTVDAGGQLLFLCGFGLVILALTWAGATYAWGAAAVLAPLCAGAALVGLFVLYERLMAPGHALARRWPLQKSMLPWKLVASKDVGLLFYINFATGAAMYSVLYFCNLYFTMVKLYGPAYAGIQLLFYTPGLGVGVYLSMYLLNGWPRKTFAPLMLGSVVEAVGIAVMGWALWSERLAVIFGMMALTGAGTGMRFMPASIHAVGFFPNHVATVISLMAVALPFGGTLALTVMASVFNNTSGIAGSSPLRDVAALSQLAPDALAAVVHSAKMGIVWAFVAITPFMILCIAAAAALGNVNITKHQRQAVNVDGDGQGGDYEEQVTRGVYLLELLHHHRRRRRQRQRRNPRAVGRGPDPEKNGGGGSGRPPGREVTIQAFVCPD